MVEQSPSFLSDLRENAENIGIAVGSIGLVLAAYQLWVPVRIIEQNHVRVTALAHWISRGSWLNLMQRGVGWVLRLMQLLYGPPHDNSRRIVGEYLTVRAWKMSAWIAAFLLIVVPVFVGQFAILIAEYRSGRPIPWTVLPVFTGMTLLLALPFILTWRTIRCDDAFANHTGVEDLGNAATAIIVEGTKVAILPAATAFVAIVIGQFVSSNSFAVGVLVTSSIAIIIIALLTSLLRAIRRHAFLAPPAFIAILIVIGIYMLQSLVVLIPILGGFRRADWPALILLPGWIMTVWSMVDVVKSHETLIAERVSIRFVWIILIGAGVFFALGNLDLEAFSGQLLKMMIGIVFVLLAPYTLAIYAAIYANAVPDWFSVALTRSVLSRAARTRSLRHFFLFLVWDLACAVGLCILTAAILIAAFVFAGIMIAMASSYVPEISDQRPALFFLGSLEVPRILFEWLTGSTGLSSLSGEARAGGTVVLVLALLSLTSLVPTALNALAIIGLIVARCFAIVLMPPFGLLHGLLAVEDTTDPEERKRMLLRSAVLIAIFVTLLIVGIYAAYWWAILRFEQLNRQLP